MEIEPFLIASSVEMVIAQRLVRRLLPRAFFLPPQCPKATFLASLSLLEVDPSEVVHAGQGVAVRRLSEMSTSDIVCRGYFRTDEDERSDSWIGDQQCLRSDIREVALKEGMSTLQGSAGNKSSEGSRPSTKSFVMPTGLLTMLETPFGNDEHQNDSKYPQGAEPYRKWPSSTRNVNLKEKSLAGEVEQTTEEGKAG